MTTSVVHNVYIDHVDKSANDSGFHHHHGELEFNILYHKHAYRGSHDHIVTVEGNGYFGWHDHKHQTFREDNDE